MNGTFPADSHGAFQLLSYAVCKPKRLETLAKHFFFEISCEVMRLYDVIVTKKI